MTGRGVILYGPPASGKSTITLELTRLNKDFQLFPRLKVGSGRTDGYRLADDAEFNDMIAAGSMVWSNERYGSRYGVRTWSGSAGRTGHVISSGLTWLPDTEPIR